MAAFISPEKSVDKHKEKKVWTHYHRQRAVGPKPKEPTPQVLDEFKEGHFLQRVSTQPRRRSVYAQGALAMMRARTG